MIRACTLFLVAIASFTTSSKAQTKAIETGGFKFKISTDDTTLSTVFYSSGQMP